MQTLRTVLLRHRMRGGDHFDWMIEAPPDWREAAAFGRELLTWRLALPSWKWHNPRTPHVLHELIPHRRAYLHRTGAVSNRRGTVQRVDAGHAIVRRWHDSGGILDLRLRHFTGPIHLTRRPALRWRMLPL